MSDSCHIVEKELAEIRERLRRMERMIDRIDIRLEYSQKVVYVKHKNNEEN
jgi:hypothetical protein